ncbi:MAG: hypothetical protein CVT48_02145 [Thermoplasmata archaeon HGW-Thermoplasmata-1]|nr:MAG: hypothetical protein CVT48_02145 [Thermoplasmata archaeon HGW-Thermoplasmata-1]
MTMVKNKLALTAVLLVCVSIASAMTASAQTQLYGVELELLDPTVQQVAPGYSVTFKINVKNTAAGIGGIGLPDTMAITLNEISKPEGWGISIDKTSLAINAGEEKLVTVTVSCPIGADDDERAVFTVTATSENAEIAGGASGTTPEMSVVSNVGTILENVALWGLIALVSIGLIGLIAYWSLTTGMVFSAVSSTCKVRLDTTGSARYILSIYNKAREQNVIKFDVVEQPKGWSAFLDTPSLTLHGREKTSVGITVVTPADAKPGDTAIIGIKATCDALNTEKTVTLRTVCVSVETKKPKRP